jgi:hypothetical protein
VDGEQALGAVGAEMRKVTTAVEQYELTDFRSFEENYCHVLGSWQEACKA